MGVGEPGTPELSGAESRFGKEWGRLESPVGATVGAIDDSPESGQEVRVGLNAKQITNLGLEEFRSNVLNAHGVRRMVLRNTEGLTDDRVFPLVRLEFEGKRVASAVYNAFGKLSQEGSNVRVSKKLADDLGLSLGSNIAIDTMKDEPTREQP